MDKVEFRARVLLAIPAYNCETQISRVIKNLTPAVIKGIDRVILIDNLSEDETVSRAINAIEGHPLKAKFEVWQNTTNVSLGGSHKVAFLKGLKSGATHVVILHGDDQAEASEIQGLVDVAIKNPDLAAVLGTRFMKGSKLHGYSKLRIMGNVALNSVFTLVTRRKTKDLGSGLNVFNLTAFRESEYLSFSDNMTFNIDLLLFFFRRRLLTVNMPITWIEADQISNARNFTIAMQALKKLMRWRVEVHPSSKSTQGLYDPVRLK